MSITYSDYVFVALGIMHEKRMRRIVMWLIRLQNIFSILSHKWQDFRIKVTKIKWVLIFSTAFVRTFLILRRNERDTIKMYIGLHVKYPVFMSDFNET